jgi:hypothetical protein
MRAIKRDTEIDATDSQITIFVIARRRRVTWRRYLREQDNVFGLSENGAVSGGTQVVGQQRRHRQVDQRNHLTVGFQM